MLLSRLFRSDIIVLAVIMDVAIIALLAALVGQFAFGLAPCQMCIYQRIPFVAVIILGAVGLAVPRLRKVVIGVSGLAYLGNAWLAFYHTGIEQKWWDETVGCAANFDFSAPSLLDRVMSAQATSCADIPWIDPVFGLSMANYNILLCAGMFVFCMVALSRQRRSAPRLSS